MGRIIYIVVRAQLGRFFFAGKSGYGRSFAAVICHLQLAECTEELDVHLVLALCTEGEARCKTMEDEDGLAFFRQVRETLEGAA